MSCKNLASIWLLHQKLAKFLNSGKIRPIQAEGMKYNAFFMQNDISTCRRLFCEILVVLWCLDSEILGGVESTPPPQVIRRIWEAMSIGVNSGLIAISIFTKVPLPPTNWQPHFKKGKFQPNFKRSKYFKFWISDKKQNLKAKPADRCPGPDYYDWRLRNDSAGPNWSCVEIFRSSII